MIQRAQSLWLFIAAVLAFLSLTVTFFSGTPIENGLNVGAIDFKGQTYLPITVLTSGLGILSIIILFLYKDRKRQLLLTILSLVLSLGIIALYFYRKQTAFLPTGTNVGIFSLVTFLLPVCYIMAIRGIRSDMKLIRSLDRLR
jgi:hypothetical protein